MSHKSELLRKSERMTITLSTLMEYYATSKQVAGCSPKTLIAVRSNLGRFLRFLEQRGHSLRLAEVTIHDARAYVSALQGTVTKYEGHPLNHPIPTSALSPQTVWSHVRTLRAFSNWLRNEGYTKNSVFEMLEAPKLPKKKIEVLSPEEIRQVLESINSNTLMGARLHSMILLMIDTGVRAGELVGMKLADVDWVSWPKKSSKVNHRHFTAQAAHR
jgi:integrase/recombinase XerD